MVPDKIFCVLASNMLSRPEVDTDILVGQFYDRQKIWNKSLIVHSKQYLSILKLISPVPHDSKQTVILVSRDNSYKKI